ncbi:MAG: insulinase family protein, partial [Candidatus Cloacimonetes bacterium]|nr:insulinase family protein [Candidatus Cloacimonadota bacterium]
MRKTFFVLLVTLFLINLSAAELLQKTLPNGMEIVVKENFSNNSVGFYCFVKTGSISEDEHLGKGISHYLEHLVSGGTTSKRTEKEYSEISKNIGAISNAYTSKMVTAYHLIVDNTYQDQALEMLSEHIQFCVLDEYEVEREKQVILKEIVMSMTPPYSKVSQRNGEVVYPNSNMKYPIIGYTELFKTITREDLLDYYHRKYVPNNMVFVCVGNIDTEVMMEKIENTFKDFPRGQLAPSFMPVQNQRTGSITVTEEFDINTPIVFMTTILPAESYKDRIVLETALQILMSNRESPMKYDLYEQKKLVDELWFSVSASAYLPEGDISIGFITDDYGKVNETIEIIDSYIRNYSFKGFTQQDIEQVIEKKKARRLLSVPEVGQECNRIGWSMITNGIPDPYDVEMEALLRLTPIDLSNAISKHLVPKNRLVFKAVPRGTGDLIVQSEKIDYQKTEPQKITKDNITLIHRQNTENPIVSGVIWLPVYDAYEDISSPKLNDFVAELLLTGSSKYKPRELSQWLEERVVRLNSYVSDSGTFITFRCLKKDFDEIKNILTDAFSNPLFDETEIELRKKKIMAELQISQTYATTLHDDFLNEGIYQNEIYRMNNEDRTMSVIQMNRQSILETYKKYFTV